MVKIWGKLFISFIIITLVTISIGGVFLNYSFQEKFSQYVRLRIADKHENVLYYMNKSLESQIALPQFLMNLSHFSVMEKVRVQIFEPGGNLLFDSYLSEMSMMMMPYGLPRKKSVSPQAYITEEELVLGSQSLQVRIISELGEDFWSPEDMTFRQAIYTSLLGSLGIGLILTIFFSGFTSSMITRPVTELKDAALRFSRGNWKTRVQIQSRDELQELGESFNKMAHDLEHLENLRRKMTSDLSHELRNPLMSIQNYIEGMLDGVIDPDEVHLTDLHEEVQRLTRMISDLEKLSKAEGERQIQATQVDFSKEFEPYFERLKMDYDQKGVHFQWSVDQTDGFLDKYIVKEILQNLLDNALKYTSSEGKVFCTLRKVKVEGRIGLEIIVEDTGQGIDEKDLPFIFERFFRADPSRSRQTGGTGIGLAITKELVDLLAGKIEVRSKLGEGTRFVVFIPSSE